MTKGDGWRECILEEVAEIIVSNVDKKTIMGETPVRLCNYMDVYSNEYISKPLDFMEATATLIEIKRFAIETGDVIITKDSETPDDIGIPSVVTGSFLNLICGYHLALLKPNKKIIDPVFLSKMISSPQIASYYGKIASGSTRFGLSNSGIAKTPLTIPPLPQQRKIAKILTTVDNLIEKTESLIAKYQSIKQGMMHDLFTRGVDAKGKLRPPQSEGMSNQKAYLKDLVFNVKEKLTFNKDMSKPYLGLEHLPSSAAKLICKGSASDSISSNNVFESGDILFGKLRPRLKKCIQVNFDGYCSTDILVLRAYPTVCSKYAGKILQSDDVFKEAIRSEEGTKMPRTSWRSIKEIQVFTPPLSQQRKIAEILSKQDQLIEDHEKELMIYKQLKTALMQDLLTGKVQVTPDEIDKE